MGKRGKAERWEVRGERLAAALRQNLKRRKEQARGRERAGGEKAPADETATQSSEFRRNRSQE